MKQLKTRASNTMTEGAFFSMLRSTLRRKSMHWKPIQDALIQARRPSESDNPRLKWEYQCVRCMDWFAKTGVQVDHHKEVGSLTSVNDLPSFVSNLFCEIDNLNVVCNKCHDIKTHKR